MIQLKARPMQRARPARRSAFIVACTFVLSAACTGANRSGLTAPPPSRGIVVQPSEVASARIVVPAILGLELGEARTTLMDAGLGVIPTFLASDASARGIVLHSSPSPGVRVDASTFVAVDVSAGPDPPGGIVWVTRVFRDHQKAFVGNYMGPSGSAVVAISSDADRARWEEELQTASEGRAFRLVRCDRTASALRTIQRELRSQILSGAFEGTAGWWVQARNCSVMVEGSLPASTIEQLYASYGDAVTIVDGVPPATVDPLPPDPPASSAA